MYYLMKTNTLSSLDILGLLTKEGKETFYDRFNNRILTIFRTGVHSQL